MSSLVLEYIFTLLIATCSGICKKKNNFEKLSGKNQENLTCEVYVATANKFYFQNFHHFKISETKSSIIEFDHS